MSANWDNYELLKQILVTDTEGLLSDLFTLRRKVGTDLALGGSINEGQIWFDWLWPHRSKTGKHLEKFGDIVFVCDKSETSMALLKSRPRRVPGKFH